LFRSLAPRGIDTSLLIGIVANGILSKELSPKQNRYSVRLNSSKVSATSLIDLLKEGPLFHSPIEQELAKEILERILSLSPADPPDTALLRKGKEQGSRSLRLSIQKDLEMACIELNGSEFAELCSIADPDINFETAKREFCTANANDSRRILLEHNTKMSIIYAFYCKAIA
jgi:hypothetical protein